MNSFWRCSRTNTLNSQNNISNTSNIRNTLNNSNTPSDTDNCTSCVSANNIGNIPANQNNSNRCNYNAQNLIDSLFSYIGQKCICEFDTKNGLESKNGILERVEGDYLVLRSSSNNRIMYCNSAYLVFITILC